MIQFDFPPKTFIEIHDGQARIAGRALKVKMVISRLLHGTGATIDDVMEQYDLSRAEVYAVLAYYYDHQSDIDAFFDAEDSYVAEHIPSLESLKARHHTNP